MNNVIYVSSAVLIDEDERILIAQRPKDKYLGDLWEFPGGKIEEGELPEEALVRELYEELKITTKTSCLSPFTFTSHSYNDFHAVIYIFLCRKWEGIITKTEHQELKWVKINDFSRYNFLEANMPIIAMLRDFFSKF